MPSQTNVLITGANRGIGRAFADTYLSRPNHILIALVRNPKSDTSQSLLQNASSYGANSSAILIPYDATLPTAAEDAISTIKTQHSDITHLDTVIANAGFADYFGKSTSTTPQCYTVHFTINTLGPLFLLSATLPLLRASSSPKFIALSSAAGSIAFTSTPRAIFDTEGNRRPGAAPYGASKAALNYVMNRCDIENPDITVGLFTPGPTKTGFAGKWVKWETVPGAMDVATVVEGLVKQFDGLQKMPVGDLKLRDWKGDVFPW